MKGHHVLSSSWLKTLSLSFGLWLRDRNLLGLEGVVVEAMSISDRYSILCLCLVNFSRCVAEGALHGLVKCEFMTS